MDYFIVILEKEDREIYTGQVVSMQFLWLVVTHLCPVTASHWLCDQTSDSYTTTSVLLASGMRDSQTTMCHQI